MKKRLLSILLCCVMLVGLLPTAAFAEDSAEEPSVCSCETVCTADNMNKECPVCGAESAIPQNCGQYVPVEDGTGENGSTKGTDDPDGATALSAADQVQAMINALPSAEEITEENAEEVEAQLDAIDEAAKKLSDEELDELDLSRYNEVATVLADMAVIPTAVFAEGSTAPADITGSGASDDPYLIYTASGLKAFQDAVNGPNGLTKQPGAHAKLMADIMLNDGTFGDDGNYTPGASDKAVDQWTPIGSESSPYSGTFDGNGHTISGLYVTGAVSAGLFGYTNGATIRNMAVSGYVKGKTYAGGIAGYVKGGSIQSCVNLCRVVGVESIFDDPIYGGGIAGYSESKIENCTNIGWVSVNNSRYLYAGGIVGSTDGSVIGCCNVGKVNILYGMLRYAGGIAGQSNGSITNCFWLISVTDDVNGNSSNTSTRDQLADGRVLTRLQNGDTNSPWAKTGYLAAVGMSLPLLDWQQADDHTHNTNGALGGCTCGLLTVKKGTAEDPYEIRTADDLKAFRDLVNNGESGLCAKLMNDIVLNDGTFENNWTYTPGASGKAGEKWIPIGLAANCSYDNSSGEFTISGTPYTGTFDGGGFTISGMWHTQMDDCSGLFGYIRNAAIKNVTVTGCVNGNIFAGGIVGCAEGRTTIANCVSYVHILAQARSGGIVGRASGQVTVSSCFNIGRVGIGSSYGGGIVGFADSGNVTITDCGNVGNLAMDNIGGILGSAKCNVEIANCYSAGSCIYDDYNGENFGGLVGCTEAGAAVAITNSYWLPDTAGNITGAIGGGQGTVSNAVAKTETEFANGTVLKLLQNSDKNSPWKRCGLIAEKGMTVPLLKGQNLDNHICAPADATHWESDANSHWQVCSCGERINQATHSGGTATCADKAKCEVCGESYGELNANNHTDLKYFPAKAATRTSEGNIAYWYCSGCGKYYKDAEATQEITKEQTITPKLPSHTGGSTGTDTSNKPDKDAVTSPNTGDNSKLALWSVTLCGSLAACLALAAAQRRRKRER